MVERAVRDPALADKLKDVLPETGLTAEENGSLKKQMRRLNQAIIDVDVAIGSDKPNTRRWKNLKISAVNLMKDGEVKLKLQEQIDPD